MMEDEKKMEKKKSEFIKKLNAWKSGGFNVKRMEENLNRIDNTETLDMADIAFGNFDTHVNDLKKELNNLENTIKEFKLNEDPQIREMLVDIKNIRNLREAGTYRSIFMQVLDSKMKPGITAGQESEINEYFNRIENNLQKLQDAG